jgi:hypothetical protein
MYKNLKRVYYCMLYPGISKLKLYTEDEECVLSMLFGVLKKLSRFAFQTHLSYFEYLPSTTISTGFFLFLFGKMVTVPTNVVQVLQSGTKSLQQSEE